MQNFIFLIFFANLLNNFISQKKESIIIAIRKIMDSDKSVAQFAIKVIKVIIFVIIALSLFNQNFELVVIQK